MTSAASSREPRVWVEDDGILCIDYGIIEYLTVEDIECAYRMHLEISPMQHPVLTSGRGLGKVNIDVQRYVSRPEICAVCKASALMVNSAWQMHLGRMFLYYFKPPYPTRLFTDKAEARDWLRQFLPPTAIDGPSLLARRRSTAIDTERKPEECR